MKGSWRLLSRRLHLWLGLSVGMILVLISLSGAAIVFYVELDRWLHPELQIPVPRSGEPDWEQAVRTLRATYPDKTGPWRIEVTSDQQLIPARYNQPPETRGQHFAPLLVWLSADGLQVLRQDYWGQSLLTWLYNLHYQLLLGATGTLLLGYLGIATLVLLTSGLLAWWPRKGQWRKSLQFKPRRSKSGLLYDWHKTVGLCCLLPLLLLTLTGVMLALPGPTQFLLQLLQGHKPDPGLLSWSLVTTEANMAPVLPLAKTISTVRQALPQARLAWIEVPALSGGYDQFRVQLPGDPSRRFPHSYVQVDRSSGAIVRVRDIRQLGSSDSVKNWLHPLHDGSVGGMWLRLGWLIVGVSPLLLAVLGGWRYFDRIRRTVKMA